MHRHRKLANDVVAYFRSHRPWQKIGNDEILENEEDQMLYEKAFAIIEQHPVIEPNGLDEDEFSEEEELELEEFLDIEDNS